MAVPSGLTTGRNSALWKVAYPDDVVHFQTNDKVRVLSDFESDGYSTHQGEKFIIPVGTDHSQAVGFRAEGADVPEPSFSNNLQAEFTFAEAQGTIRQSIRSQVMGQAFQAPRAAEFARLKRTLRLTYETGFVTPSSGLLTACTSASDATTLVVPNADILRKNMVIDVLVTSTGATTAGVVNAVISAISVDNDTGIGTLTLSKDLGTFGDIDTTYGVFLTNSYGQHPHGFTDIISTSNPSTGNYGGIDRTTETIWQAISRDAEEVALSAELIDFLRGEVHINSGEFTDIVYCHPYTFRDLMSATVSAKRFNDVQKMDPWGEVITVGGTTVKPWRFCPRDTIYAISRGESNDMWRIAYPTMGDGETPLYGGWFEEGDNMRRVAGKAMVEALWLSWRQVVCTRPNAQGVMNNIAWAPKGTL